MDDLGSVGRHSVTGQAGQHWEILRGGSRVPSQENPHPTPQGDCDGHCWRASSKPIPPPSSVTSCTIEAGDLKSLLFHSSGYDFCSANQMLLHKSWIQNWQEDGGKRGVRLWCLPAWMEVGALWSCASSCRRDFVIHQALPDYGQGSSTCVW